VTLSIIIVNYNVKYFLELCLCSVKKAIEKIEAEVIVIDNNSTDGSIDYLRPKFAWAHFIVNKKNEGFSKANNLGLSEAKSKYILFLNPDTIVAEDSFGKCISFLETNTHAGAIGVKMIDGSGNYLKESKRGFPFPWAAFCKLSGLSSLFPHSKIFAGYYLGFLSEKENQVIDAISGAFMFVRKEALDKTGGFDEQFFMYAEDIDLSYRIQQAGYLNYYLADTTIIHFKGESTKKDTYYVKMFYKAMNLFVNKHLENTTPVVFIVLIQSAIWLRSVFSLLRNNFISGQTKNIPEGKKVFLNGDKKSKEKVEKIMIRRKMVIARNEADADNIIFCEGDNFSFKRITENISLPNKKIAYSFYAAGSDSVVCSNDKKRGGVSFDLYP
jgi:N-acetylglucosaminyl-diphospho-decaprenol L-rhamnosyltransferase